MLGVFRQSNQAPVDALEIGTMTRDAGSIRVISPVGAWLGSCPAYRASDTRGVFAELRIVCLHYQGRLSMLPCPSWQRDATTISTNMATRTRTQMAQSMRLCRSRTTPRPRWLSPRRISRSSHGRCALLVSPSDLKVEHADIADNRIAMCD